jgi:tetratricopeptide (TPR) repeat protein
VPIFDLAIANEGLASKDTELYFTCCCKSICKGCIDSFCESGNIWDGTCPFCKAEIISKTDEEKIEELMNRVEANDAGATCQLGNFYYNGQLGLQQDEEKAIDLWKEAAKLGSNEAHFYLGMIYDDEGGDLKKAKFHYEAAAMAGHEVARYNSGSLEANSGNMERAMKHWRIAALAGSYRALHDLIICFEKGLVSRESINSTLIAYNNSCVAVRSEARDAFVRGCLSIRNEAS